MELDKPSWANRTTLVKNHDENKTYILVKLSESFSNAIQEYSAAQNNNTNTSNDHHYPYHQKYNNNIKTKHHNHPNNQNLISNSSNNKEPTIRFQGTRGAIKFPDGKCYDFSLEQSDNSVECIRQTKTRWETVGKMSYCLQVKGKDDVYQMTKTKLKAAEQEKRKYCAKLLGSPEHNNSISNNNKKTKLLNNSNSIPNKQPLLAPAPTPLIPPPSSNNTLQTQPSSQNHNNTHHHNHNNHKQHNHNNHHNHHQPSPPPPPPLPQNNILQQPPSSVTTTNNNNTTNNNVNALPPAGPQNKYPDIMDAKQLKKYKAEFDKDFQEYQNLHGYLHRIEERFRKLRELLKQSVEGSPEWESAKEQIFNEYERVKSDSNFHIARREYKQLRNKLAHIKGKIFQFKQRKKDLPVLKQQQQQPPPPQPKHHQQSQPQQQHHHHSSKKHHKHKHQQLQQHQRLQK